MWTSQPLKTFSGGPLHSMETPVFSILLASLVVDCQSLTARIRTPAGRGMLDVGLKLLAVTP